MKRFNPAARVDEVAEYRTSVHGKRLAQGDQNVATCIDCHSVHGIRRKTNPDGPVYPTHVAETCGRCHSDPKEGLGHARAALLSAQRSLEELGYRRRGLFVAPGIIITVLVALAIKIRRL